jgi:hypothetical protein
VIDLAGLSTALQADSCVFFDQQHHRLTRFFHPSPGSLQLTGSSEYPPCKFLDDITHLLGLNRVHCDLYGLHKFNQEGVSGEPSFGVILADIRGVCLAIAGPQCGNS